MNQLGGINPLNIGAAGGRSGDPEHAVRDRRERPGSVAEFDAVVGLPACTDAVVHSSDVGQPAAEHSGGAEPGGDQR